MDDLLYRTSNAWENLTEYAYILTYGYKQQLYTIDLTFASEDFYHLAGFQYLKDLALPRYNSSRTLQKILDRTIREEQIKNSINYEKMVHPRLKSIVHMKDMLESEFKFYSFAPRRSTFETRLKADYMIASRLDSVYYIFIIKVHQEEHSMDNCICCSTFIKGDRDYETNQSWRTILKKERIHIPTQKKDILYNRLEKDE